MPRPRTDIEPRIVRAARARFLEQGVDGASLRAIADDAGTSIGMVYYYFPTKDDLFFAVVEQTYARLLDDMARALAADAPVKTRILRLYERIGAVSDDELATIRLVVREVLVSSSRFERLVALFLRGHIPLVLATIADGIREGVLDDGRPPTIMLMATLALGTMPQILRRAAGSRVPFAKLLLTGPALSAELVDVLMSGIGARSGSLEERGGARPPPPSKPMRATKQKAGGPVKART